MSSRASKTQQSRKGNGPDITSTMVNGTQEMPQFLLKKWVSPS
jgi:hypothetical protein